MEEKTEPKKKEVYRPNRAERRRKPERLTVAHIRGFQAEAIKRKVMPGLYVKPKTGGETADAEV